MRPEVKLRDACRVMLRSVEQLPYWGGGVETSYHERRNGAVESSDEESRAG